MPKRPPTHEDRLRKQQPVYAQQAKRAESREDYTRRVNDPDQVEATRLRHSAAWERARAQVLSEEPLCRECMRLGLTTVATQVDHIIGLIERPDLALTRSNLQSLCTRCHGDKSGRERRGQECA